MTRASRATYGSALAQYRSLRYTSQLAKPWNRARVFLAVITRLLRFIAYAGTPHGALDSFANAHKFLF